MPITTSWPRGALLLALAALTPLLFASEADATRSAKLRVVGPDGQTLAQHTQYTGGVRIKTDRRARCFGRGNQGSGDRARVPGPTALGAVRDATAKARALRPLSVTDAFEDDGFGLGVCGIGGFESSGDSFWYLKHNRSGSEVSGSQARIEGGDNVLWYLAPSFPPPAELVLRGPARARPGQSVPVRVVQFADDGSKSPVAGAEVTHGDRPTGASGQTTVTIPRRPADGGRSSPRNVWLSATRGDEIPSNALGVCVSAALRRCTNDHGEKIIGSGKPDRIRATKGDDRIVPRGGRDVVRAREGDDVINARGGGRDRIFCGPGRDVAIVDRTDRVRGCEVVRRK